MKKTLILFVGLLILTSCSKSENLDTEVVKVSNNIQEDIIDIQVVNENANTEKEVSINIIQTQGIDIENNEYNLLINEKLIPINNRKSFTIKIKPNDVEVYALVNGKGEPILMGTSSTKSNDNIILSSETSAYVFVSRSPVFWGITVRDIDELNNRIKAHEKFPQLVESIEDYISWNSCPMDGSCNPTATRKGDEIAREINFSDLVEK